MVIEKNRESVGWWNVTAIINGEFIVSCDKNKMDALDDMFKKLQWLEIGNWTNK